MEKTRTQIPPKDSEKQHSQKEAKFIESGLWCWYRALLFRFTGAGLAEARI